ncbi:calmodulin-like [Lingula anatina]|nr:calmodulin-like [Lingula anatina]|eukprot:XP_013384152.1 calmodulin-like [Lingula anatina]
MIDAISVESSGISFQAFVDYCSGYTSLRKEEEEYLEAFRVLDSSGTGRLSKDDIKYVASKLGIVGFDADDVMAKIDTKQDGVIDYEEFVQMMKTTTSTQKKPSTEPGWGTPHLV